VHMAIPLKLPPRYEYEGPPRQGGQGTIYVCRDKYLDRQVAIKVMKGVSDPSAIRKELAAIQAVRSRHVAQVYDLIVAGSTFGLVQEFVPGPTVKEHARTAQGTNDFLKVLYQIARGLSDIHESKKIHRDIKPSNMRFDQEEVVKILDFGLAADALPDIETVDARGTPSFIAPELYRTPPVRYTCAVDTFAFGVTARVIAEGGALLPAFRQTPPYGSPLPSFASCPIKLAGDIVSILDQTLDEDPKKRPTMGDVRDVLGRRLLFGRHRAVVTYGAVHELCEPGKAIQLKVGNDGIAIKYDGLQFTVDAVVGDVYINNARPTAGSALPDCCVITLGLPSLGSSRTFVPFNVSHPEVVL